MYAGSKGYDCRTVRPDKKDLAQGEIDLTQAVVRVLTRGGTPYAHNAVKYINMFCRLVLIGASYEGYFPDEENHAQGLSRLLSTTPNTPFEETMYEIISSNLLNSM